MNYDPDAGFNDGSCVFSTCVSSGPVFENPFFIDGAVEQIPQSCSDELQILIEPYTLTALDECDGEVPVTRVIETNELPGCGQTNLVTYTATNSQGQTSTTSYTFEVIDATPPVINAYAAPITVELDIDGCLEAWDLPFVENYGVVIDAYDECENGVNLETWYSDGLVELDYQGSVCYSFTRVHTIWAMDDCGNETTTTVHQPVFIADITPPQISDLTLTMDCSGYNPSSLYNEVATQLGLSACDYLTLSEYGSEPSGCGNSVNLLFWAAVTDACGNQAVADVIVSLQDNTAPSLLVQVGGTLVECPASEEEIFEAISYEVYDDCSEVDVVMEVIDNSGDCGGLDGPPSFHVLVYAIDECGNMSSTQQVPFWQFDSTSPEFVSLPPDVTVFCGEEIPLILPTAFDACDGYVQVFFQDEWVGNDGCPGEYQIFREFSAFDACNNSSFYIQVIDVVDENSPVFSGTGGIVNGEVLTICEGEFPPAPLAVSAIDACQGLVDVMFTEEFIVESESEFGVEFLTVVRSYVAEDCAGNSAEFQYSIEVLPNPVFGDFCDDEDACVSTNPDCFDAWMAELPSFVDLGCEYGEFADWTVGNLPNHSLVVPDVQGCCPDEVVQIAGGGFADCFAEYNCPAQNCGGNRPVLELSGLDGLGLEVDDLVFSEAASAWLTWTESSSSLPGMDSYSYNIQGAIMDGSTTELSLDLYFKRYQQTWGELIPLVSYLDIPEVGRLAITQMDSFGTAPSFGELPSDVIGSEFQWSCLKDGVVVSGTGVFTLPASEPSILCFDFCCDPSYACSTPVIHTAKFNGVSGHTLKHTSISYSDTTPPTIQLDAPPVDVSLDLNGQGAGGVDLDNLDIPYELSVLDNCASSSDINYTVEIEDVGPFNFGNGEYLFIRRYNVEAIDWGGDCTIYSNVATAEFDQQIVVTDIGN